MMTVVKECNKRKREDEMESCRKKIKLLADVRDLLFENDLDNPSPVVTILNVYSKLLYENNRDI
jgi:tRNA(Ser,Leu) C12 N-acetylase TAN1